LHFQKRYEIWEERKKKGNLLDNQILIFLGQQKIRLDIQNILQIFLETEGSLPCPQKPLSEAGRIQSICPLTLFQATIFPF
jgi:hypothetical protein